MKQNETQNPFDAEDMPLPAGGGEAQAPVDSSDPFDVPAGDTDTDFPLLAQGVKTLEITEVSKDESKKTPGTFMLTMVLKTMEEYEDTKGDTLSKGYPVYHRITITPSEKRDAKRISKDIAILLKAIGRPQLTPRQVINDPNLLVGGIANCKVIVTKETDEFPSANAIKAFIPPEDSGN